jgi:hypothetical protein
MLGRIERTIGDTHDSAHLDNVSIPGLYAVGRASVGITCPHYYSSGLSLGEGLKFGRIAGCQCGPPAASMTKIGHWTRLTPAPTA